MTSHQLSLETPTHRFRIDVAVDQLLDQRSLAHALHPAHQHLPDLANFGI